MVAPSHYSHHEFERREEVSPVALRSWARPDAVGAATIHICALMALTAEKARALGDSIDPSPSTAKRDQALFAAVVERACAYRHLQPSRRRAPDRVATAM